MADDRRALARCLGGTFCTHAEGTCTATVPAPVGLGHPLPPAPTTVTRDPDDERRAHAIAYGLWALEAPLGSSVVRGWDKLTPARRELLMARARFVLDYAAERLG